MLKRVLYFLPVLLILLCVGGSYGAGLFTTKNSLFTVALDPMQSSECPVIISISIQNTSHDSIGYGSGEGDRHPGGEMFKGQLTDQTGKTWPVSLMDIHAPLIVHFNDFVKIKPGETITCMDTLGPLQPGAYTFTLENSKPVHFETKQDPQLKFAYEQKVIAGLGQRDRFFQELADGCGDDRINSTLLSDLLSDDSAIATAAADALERQTTLPPKTEETCIQAESKNLALPKPSRGNLFVSLARILSITKSDQALKSVVELAHSPALDAYSAEDGQWNQVRANVVRYLSDFPQPSVGTELRGLMNDRDSMVRMEASGALARKQDPVAYEYLMKLAQSKSPDGNGLIALSNYKSDPKIVAVLKKALRNPDLNPYAEAALGQLGR